MVYSYKRITVGPRTGSIQMVYTTNDVLAAVMKRFCQTVTITVSCFVSVEKSGACWLCHLTQVTPGLGFKVMDVLSEPQL